jgi:endoribonuclease Dicer
MPKSKKLCPRGYQTSAATEAIEKNTIINIRTGGGKTLIAVIVIDKFLQQSKKVVCFLVPSRALVSQQGEYLRKNCQDRNGKPLCVAELSGAEVDHWRLPQWTEVIRDSDILVGTPEIFRQGLIDKGFFSPCQFSLFVFDECHNAVGKSPMATIMRDSVLKLEESIRPRILGLTASFVCGSTSNSASILKKRKEMETLFQANICSPVIPIEDDCETKTEFIECVYPVEDFSQYKEFVEKMVKDVLRSIPCGLFDEMDKWVAKAWNIFSSLGLIHL